MKNEQIEILANKIIEGIEKNDLPVWVKPWKGYKSALPKNALTQKEYKGVNLIELFYSGKYPEFATFNQIKELGGSVCKGAKSLKICYVIFDEDEDKKTFKGKNIIMFFP